MSQKARNRTPSGLGKETDALTRRPLFTFGTQTPQDEDFDPLLGRSVSEDALASAELTHGDAATSGISDSPDARREDPYDDWFNIKLTGAAEVDNRHLPAPTEPTPPVWTPYKIKQSQASGPVDDPVPPAAPAEDTPQPDEPELAAQDGLTPAVTMAVDGPADTATGTSVEAPDEAGSAVEPETDLTVPEGSQATVENVSEADLFATGESETGEQETHVQETGEFEGPVGELDPTQAFADRPANAPEADIRSEAPRLSWDDQPILGGKSGSASPSGLFGLPAVPVEAWDTPSTKPLVDPWETVTGSATQPEAPVAEAAKAGAATPAGLDGPEPEVDPGTVLVEGAEESSAVSESPEAEADPAPASPLPDTPEQGAPGPAETLQSTGTENELASGQPMEKAGGTDTVTTDRVSAAFERLRAAAALAAKPAERPLDDAGPSAPEDATAIADAPVDPATPEERPSPDPEGATDIGTLGDRDADEFSQADAPDGDAVPVELVPEVSITDEIAKVESAPPESSDLRSTDVEIAETEADPMADALARGSSDSGADGAPIADALTDGGAIEDVAPAESIGDGEPPMVQDDQPETLHQDPPVGDQPASREPAAVAGASAAAPGPRRRPVQQGARRGSKSVQKNKARRKPKGPPTPAWALFAGTLTFGFAAILIGGSLGAPLSTALQQISVFLWYWVGLAAVSAGIWLAGRRWAMAVASAILCVIGLQILVPATGIAPANGPTSQTIGWVNLEGSPDALADALQQADANKADLLILAELPSGFSAPPRGWSMIEQPVPGQPNALAVLSKGNWRATTVPGEPTMARPVDNSVTVIAINASSLVTDPNRQADINRAATRAGDQDTPVIAVGDFGEPAWSSQMKQVSQYSGGTRLRCGGWLGATYSGLGGLFGWSPDHVFMINGRATSCKIGDGLSGSRHRPLWIGVPAAAASPSATPPAAPR
jgi:hypothetical protein